MTALLFDQNLPPRMSARLADIFSQSVHVSEVGLASALDQAVWEFARDRDLVIVSKDSDFADLGSLNGFPPKVVWIRRGNCSTSEIESLLRNNQEAIDLLAESSETGVLTLY